MKKTPLLIAFVAIISLAIGWTVARVSYVGIQIAPTPPETEVVPAPSLQKIMQQALQQFCVSSSAFANLTKTDDHTELKTLQGFNVRAEALSDRGVICTVDAMLLTRHKSAGAATVTSRPINATILMAISGESEVVTAEFAAALARSSAVKAMASNVGNDGTVMKKVRLTH